MGGGGGGGGRNVLPAPPVDCPRPFYIIQGHVVERQMSREKD